MRTLLEMDPSSPPMTAADRAHLEAALLRADEPAVRRLPRDLRAKPARIRMRLPLLVSLVLHALALGALLWYGLPAAPEPVTIGTTVAFRAADETPEQVPVVEIDFDELVELDEPPPLQPVLANPEALPPEESFELEYAEPPPPLATMEVPLRLARLRVPRKRQPVVTLRPTPPPPAPRVVSIPTPIRRRPVPAPLPRRAAPRPGPMRVLYAPDPRHYYPHDARQRGIGGVARVLIVVDAAGTVTSAAIVQSSGDASLDAAATRLVRAYRFTPGTGLRSARLPIAFRLL